MLKRKIESYLEDYLKSDSNKMLILAGARQIGKSYIIRHVGKKLFPNYVEINMAEDSYGQRNFANAKTLDDFYLNLSIVAGNKLKNKHNTLVFIDEIQTYDHLLTMVKFLKQDDRYTYIASGSLLGITLKETPSLPIGSVIIKNMYPLDFEEFLWANGVGEDAIATIESKIDQRESLSESLHTKMMDLFKKYLLVGGMPDAVNSFVSKKNIVEVREIQREIHHLYRLDAARYEQENQRKLKIQRIFEMIPSNLENKKKRVMAAKIEGKKDARMGDYSDEFEYLISAGIALQVQAVSKPSYPIIENSGKNLLKLYLNDVGIFTGILYQNQIQAIMNNIGSVNLGSVYEAVVAQELAAHGFRLCYYDNKKMGEVDFLIDDTDNLSVTPIEVKSGKDYYVHSALSNIIKVKEYNIKQAFVLNNDREIRIKNGITYLPIYSVMFLKKNKIQRLILE
ncbi:MAG: ATP-binding protein [Salinivirgaceae bacterium]|nr:ATP-binding protein [Salinivirgaceae bacterium]